MAIEDLEYRTVRQFVDLQLNYINSSVPASATGVFGAFITAIAYAVALVAAVLQRLIQLVLKAARLSTAEGEDLDSFVADFGLARTEGTYATGVVLFSRLNAAVSSILIPDGTIVQTAGSQPIQFVTIPSALGNYNALLRGHILATGSFSASAAVKALEVGSTSNVGATTLTQIASTVTGIDNVTNSTAINNGQDAESDEALRQDFVNYIQSLPRATLQALSNAIALGRPQITHTLVENLNPPTGIIQAYYDDGSGTAGSYQTEIQAAIDLVRPAGIRVDATAATATQLAMILQVVVNKATISNFVTLRQLIRNQVLASINGTKVGENIRPKRIIRDVLNLGSPGDEVITATHPLFPSTTQTIKVLSTLGMAVGQILNIGTFLTSAKTYPKIQSIPDSNTIILERPLLLVPPANTAVSAYSLKPDLLVDINLFALNSINATTTVTGSGTPIGFTIASSAGLVNGDCFVLTDEADPLNPVYYSFAADVSLSGNGSRDLMRYNVTGTNIAVIHPTGGLGVGLMDAAGTFAATPPAVGSKFVSFSYANSADDKVITALQVGRIKAIGPNAIGIHIQYNEEL